MSVCITTIDGIVNTSLNSSHAIELTFINDKTIDRKFDLSEKFNILHTINHLNRYSTYSQFPLVKILVD